jgi:hypothetical protein
MKPVYAKFGDALEQLCRTEPTDDQFRAGNGQVWLAQADALARALADELLSELLKPQTRSAINRERLLALQVLRMQVVLGSPRTLAFSAVRMETREVIRTVEVAAPAPPPQPPPDPNAECNRMLRQATNRWYGMASDILGPYGENGRANDAYQVVVQVRREMNGLSSDADVFPVAVSWQQRLHRAATDPANSRRTGGVFDFFQLSESEQSRIQDLAQDIRSQLRFCRGSY